MKSLGTNWPYKTIRSKISLPITTLKRSMSRSIWLFRWETEVCQAIVYKFSETGNDQFANKAIRQRFTNCTIKLHYSNWPRFRKYSLSKPLVSGNELQSFYDILFCKLQLPRLRVVSVITLGSEIYFLGNCVAELTAYVFVIIPNFIFTPVIEVKIKFLG